MGKKGLCILGAISFAANVALVCIGLFCNNKFLEISLSNILSLDVTVFVSVLLVQILLSKRRKNEFVVKKLEELSAEFHDEGLFDHSKGIEAGIKQKSIANRLLFISNTCPQKGEERDSIKYISEHFEELRTFYGDHSNIKPNDSHYQREIVNITDKIVKLQLLLYNISV